MPDGNHHYTPSGIWFKDGTQSTIPRLFLRSCLKFTFVLSLAGCIAYWRSVAHGQIYNQYNGRTLTLGTHTIATHEPASVEEIDRLKAAMDARKRAKWEPSQRSLGEAN